MGLQCDAVAREGRGAASVPFPVATVAVLADGGDWYAIVAAGCGIRQATGAKSARRKRIGEG